MPGWWCGPADTKAVDHSTLTPCTAETAGSPVLLLIAAIVLYVQLNRVRLLKRHRSYLGLGNYGIIEAFVAAVLVALTVSHTGWLIFYIAQHQAAYHYLYEAVMAIYWAAALVRCLSLLLFCTTGDPALQHECTVCTAGSGVARKTALCLGTPQVPHMAGSSCIHLGIVHLCANLPGTLGRSKSCGAHSPPCHLVLSSPLGNLSSCLRDSQVSSTHSQHSQYSWLCTPCTASASVKPDLESCLLHCSGGLQTYFRRRRLTIPHLPPYAALSLKHASSSLCIHGLSASSECDTTAAPRPSCMLVLLPFHMAFPWPPTSLLSCCRPLQAEEEDILREALLASGTDPEAPVDSTRFACCPHLYRLCS